MQWAKASDAQTMPTQKAQDGNKIGMRKARVTHDSARDSMERKLSSDRRGLQGGAGKA